MGEKDVNIQQEIQKLREQIAEIKRIVTESGADPTVIGEARMLLWRAEQELRQLAAWEEGTA